MREKLSIKEEKLFRELAAKKKRIERHNRDFFAEADARKCELLERWHIPYEEEALGEPTSIDESSIPSGLCSDDANDDQLPGQMDIYDLEGF